MKYISLLQFLKIFIRQNSMPPFSKWLKSSKVKSGQKTVSLEAYQLARKISTTDLRIIYDHIVNRNEYLTRFFQTSLAIHPHQITDEPMSKSHLNNNSKVTYKNVIRNLHFRNILQNTHSGWAGLPSYIDVLLDLYKHDTIDYKILTPSALHYIKAGRIGSVFSSFYFRASILNPYLVFSLNESVLKGTKIFTPTLGWSSYAYGFAESHQVTEYVGCDVIPDVCKKTADLLASYPKIKTAFYCQPSESLLKNNSFMTKYRHHFDVVFFSPPYYELELYPGENQSTNVYKTYNDWLKGYWLNTVKVCKHVLKPGGKLCYILSSGGGPNSTVDILKDMNTITRTMFTLDASIPMYNKNVHVTSGSHRETSEKIMVFTC
jgi:SAM-dependent methyltransferase